MFMQRSIFLLIALCAFCTGIKLTRFADCGSSAHVHEVTMDNCNQEPCHLFGGKTYYGHTTFIPRVIAHKATLHISGVFAGNEVPLGSGNDKCRILHCPLQAGATYVLNATLDMPFYTAQRFAGKYQLKDENDRDILCIVLPLYLN